jgi:mono/diheme cytochrome c family protein
MVRRLRAIIVSWLLLLAVVVILGLVKSAPADTNTTSSPEQQRRLMFRRGAELWPVYCNTCHNARPASEFSVTEWNIIMMHMRTQANLTADDAQALLEYLRSSR